MPLTKRGLSPSVGVSPRRRAPPVFLAPKSRDSVQRFSGEAPRLKVSGRLAPEPPDRSSACVRAARWRVLTPLCFLGSRFISKSEDNLLTPRCASSAPRPSWSVSTPVGTQVFGAESFSDTPMKMCLRGACASEPTVVASEPPKTPCCASSAVSPEKRNSGTQVQNRAGPTPIKDSESGCDLQASDPCGAAGLDAAEPSEGVARPAPEDNVLSADAGTPSFLAQRRWLSGDPNITFGQADLAAFTPLHIDSFVFEPDAYSGPPRETTSGSFCAAPVGNPSTEGGNEEEAEQVTCSGLVQTLFELDVSSGLQSTPYKPGGDEHRGPGGASRMRTVASAEPPIKQGHPEVASGVPNQRVQAASVPEGDRRRVADHIHHFNKLTLRSPTAARLAQVRSPLKFQRTPVRQTVRRINSLSGEGRRCTRTPRPVVKSVSLESGLSPHPQHALVHSGAPEEVPGGAFATKRPPAVPPRQPSTRARKLKAGALGDVTNTTQPKSRTEGSVCRPTAAAAAAQKPDMRLVEKDTSHYRGSPRNPLTQGRLLSATRPVDL